MFGLNQGSWFFKWFTNIFLILSRACLPYVTSFEVFYLVFGLGIYPQYTQKGYPPPQFLSICQEVSLLFVDSHGDLVLRRRHVIFLSSPLLFWVFFIYITFSVILSRARCEQSGEWMAVKAPISSNDWNLGERIYYKIVVNYYLKHFIFHLNCGGIYEHSYIAKLNSNDQEWYKSRSQYNFNFRDC